ncbi:SpoIID/LytB domain-containing protein [Fusobacterium sp. MFO224]|uniref:SpoIID/LytB domain-containing protein n=1 Tax=Fusobacterium sp. MFO224 TaxID=3378070 RepID=UPI003852E8A5
MKKIYMIFATIMILFTVGCSNNSTKKNVNSKEVYKENRVSYFEKYGCPEPTIRLGSTLPYLQATSHMRTNKFLDGYSEKKVLKFFKDLDVKGYGDNSYYWRWYFSIDRDSYGKGISKALSQASKSKYNHVYTLYKGKWIYKNLDYNCLGTLQDIVVMERGKSGVITYLLIKGTNGTYLLKGEYTVRKVLGLNRNNVGKLVKVRLSKRGTGEYSEKVTLKNPNLLLSGFLAVEKKGNSFNIYGGGYGHGVGMSQYGANDLANNYGYNYAKILKTYYKDITIKNMYGMNGVSKYIRVGLTTTGFGSLDHKTLTMYSTSKAEIWNGWMRIKLSPRDKIKVISDGRRQILYVNGKKRVETIGQLNFKSSDNKFVITSIRRAQRKTRYPVYRGKMETHLSRTNSHKIRVINEVFLEDYLVQVVPSEMPKGFGLEALKAQAIAARTYALNDYLKAKYKKEGFHVRDDTYSQVYNRIDTNTDTVKAVKLTRGKVMLYNGKPIDAKYYSTSCGYGAASQNVW